ncbi:MAG: redoxin domain-containing protein [Planctomycetota bacterium]
MSMFRNLAAIAFAILIMFPVFAAPPPGFHELQIGDKAPDFDLKGIDDRNWTLADFSDAKVLVVYFTSNHCPVCHAQDPRLMSLIKRLDGKDFQVVAINPNSGDGLRPDELGYSYYDDSFEHMKLYAKDEGFTFPYLYDGDTQEVAKSYGCLATPHVFVFDANRKLRYKGWLDDSRYPDSSTVKRTDAADAIEALLADREVAVSVTKPFGCSTKWREKISGVNKAATEWKQTPITLDKADAKTIAELVKNPTEKYRLFNVWSTTCIPCVGEFPGLISISKRMGLRPFELITISTDLPRNEERVRSFLSNMEAALPKRLAASLKAEGRSSNNYLYTEASMDDLINALDPQWEGPQPHTILVAPGGEVVYRHNGAVSEKELLDAVLKNMSTGYQP